MAVEAIRLVDPRHVRAIISNRLRFTRGGSARDSRNAFISMHAGYDEHEIDMHRDALAGLLSPEDVERSVAQLRANKLATAAIRYLIDTQHIAPTKMRAA